MLKHKGIYIFMLFIATLLCIACKREKPSFWAVKNINATNEHVETIKKAINQCELGLKKFFLITPSSLQVITYGTRDDFVKGLQQELGFSEQSAAYFKKSSAPRPLQGKLLIPPDQKHKNICHEIVHHYLESNTNRDNLLNAKWFDEGTATYLADFIFDKNSLKKKKNWLKKQQKEEYIDVKKMRLSQQWSKLHKNSKTRNMAYVQSGLLTEHFFKNYTVANFQDILEGMKAQPFEQTFKEVTGVKVDAFYKMWLIETNK